MKHLNVGQVFASGLELQLQLESEFVKLFRLIYVINFYVLHGIDVDTQVFYVDSPFSAGQYDTS